MEIYIIMLSIIGVGLFISIIILVVTIRTQVKVLQLSYKKSLAFDALGAFVKGFKAK
jgi:hypothetical protein